jgi:GTP:adenosylcobinamide-phosphate guanylyltransferase
MAPVPTPADLPASVFVLAGRRGEEDTLALHARAPHRSLVAIGGTPMLERVVGTLLEAGIEHVVVSTDARELVLAVARLRELNEAGRVQIRDSAKSPAASVLDFLTDTAASRFPCLVTTADHALLTSHMVRTFWAAAAQSDADLAVGIVKEDLFETRFPGLRRTFVRLADDAFKAANLFAFLRPHATAVPSFWRRVEQDRKKPWRLVRAFGGATLLRYLSGRLTVTNALERVRRTTGARVALIPLPFPEAAIDVDNPVDLEVALSVLSGRAATAEVPTAG